MFNTGVVIKYLIKFFKVWLSKKLQERVLPCPCLPSIDFQMVVIDPSEILNYVDKDRLASEFGGDLEVDIEEWLAVMKDFYHELQIKIKEKVGFLPKGNRVYAYDPEVDAKSKKLLATLLEKEKKKRQKKKAKAKQSKWNWD